MKTFIIAGVLTLIAASAQAGLLKGPQQAEAARQTHAETNSASAVRPAAKPLVRPSMKKPRKKHTRRREDDDERDDD